MAVYEVFSQPELRRYKTSVCSKATIFQFICIILTFIPPLLIAYRSQGFWQKADLYNEQGDISFKHDVLVVLDTSSADDDSSYVTWSTHQNYNSLQMTHFRVPLIKSREQDANRDGKNDQLYFYMEMPMLDSENVIGVQLILTFDYRLYKFSQFAMESMAYIQYSSPRSGGALKTIGDLKLQQREPLSHKGNDSRYNIPVIDASSIYAESYEFARIFSDYSERNVTTVYGDDYPIWIAGRGAGKPFIIEATIKYPDEQISYTPGFWQLMKWAWIQYLAVLLVFLFVFDRIKQFIFQNQLVTTVVDRPSKPKMM